MFIDEEAVCRLHPIGVPCFGLVLQQNMAHLRRAPGSGVTSINIALLRSAPAPGFRSVLANNFEAKPCPPFRRYTMATKYMSLKMPAETLANSITTTR